MLKRFLPLGQLMLTARCSKMDQITHRYAHAGKNKKGGELKKGKSPALSFDPASVDFGPLFDVQAVKKLMQMEVDNFRQELLTQCSLRTNLSAFEQLHVQVAKESSPGRTVPLSHVATVTLKNPQLVVIHVSSTDNMQAVKEALEQSALNINPQVQGLTLHLPLPKITRERREEMVLKCAHLLGTLKKRLDTIKHKIQGSWDMTPVENKKSMSKEELIYKGRKYTDQLLRDYVSEAEIIMKAKQKELTTELQ